MVRKRESEDLLQIEVKNFGPIERAMIDLRPLTVFVGPSNTGKSYLATLIYSLHRFWKYDPHVDSRLGYMRDREFLLTAAHGLARDVAVKQAMQKWARRRQPSRLPLRRAREEVPSIIANRLWELMAFHSGEEMVEAIERAFGASSDDLRRKGARRSASVLIGRNNSLMNKKMAPSYTIKFNHRVSSSGEFTPASPIILTYRHPRDSVLRWLPSHLSMAGSSHGEGTRPGFDAEGIARGVAPFIINSLLSPLTSQAYYLPSSRTGIMNSHQVVVSSLIRGAVSGGLRNEPPVDTLSGVSADFLERLLRLDRTQQLFRERREKVASKAMRAAGEIEQYLLSGEIHKVDSPSGYPWFFYQPKGWESVIPLTRTSSMVSELAPVVLYLRYVVEPGNVLIIDEPEAHLHPKAQREFMRQIAAVVKAGVRVIITTHSEWVLEELANIVYASELPDGNISDNGSENEIALAASEVGVWLFKQEEESRGSLVRKLALEKMTGTFPSGFSEVSRDLYNEWTRIARIVDGEFD